MVRIIKTGIDCGNTRCRGCTHLNIEEGVYSCDILFSDERGDCVLKRDEKKLPLRHKECIQQECKAFNMEAEDYVGEIMSPIPTVVSLKEGDTLVLRGMITREAVEHMSERLSKALGFKVPIVILPMDSDVHAVISKDEQNKVQK